MVMKSNSLVLVLSLLWSANVVAQSSSPIVDLNSAETASESKPAVVRQSPTPRERQQSEQYYQMQVLQDEVRTLRGMLEEINYQLQQIKQRQMDDYLDLDRRVLSLTNSNNTSTGEASGVDDAADTAVVDGQVTDDSWRMIETAKVVVDPAEMKADYDNATKLLLKNRDFDGAISALREHINKFPQSPYVANAHYWLGEIYDVRQQTDLAVKSFRTVVDDFGDHSKAMDARFKLGKLYHKLGETRKAKSLLKEAAKSSGGAGAKARAYLQANNLQ
jgi:tol-pal system protein YbgF